LLRVPLPAAATRIAAFSVNNIHVDSESLLSSAAALQAASDSSSTIAITRLGRAIRSSCADVTVCVKSVLSRSASAGSNLVAGVSDPELGGDPPVLAYGQPAVGAKRVIADPARRLADVDLAAVAAELEVHELELRPGAGHDGGVPDLEVAHGIPSWIHNAEVIRDPPAHGVMAPRGGSPSNGPWSIGSNHVRSNFTTTCPRLFGCTMRTTANRGNGFPLSGTKRSPHAMPRSRSSRTIAAPRVPVFLPGRILAIRSNTEAPVIIAMQAWAQLDSVGWRT